MRLRLFFLTLLALRLCTPASAQTNQSVPKLSTIAISLGALLPSDSDTRHRTGSALLLGELRYTLPAPVAARSRTVLIGTAANSNRAYEGSGIYSGTVGEVFSLRAEQSPLAAQTPYVGAGVGLYGMDLRFVHAFVRVGAYAEAGYNLSSALFVNAQYRVADRGDGASITLGARF
jgi:hypothetical protein